MSQIPITEARDRLAAVVDEARNEPVYLTRRNRRVAAVVDASVLERLLSDAEELEDIRAVDEAWAEIGPPDTPLDTALGRAIDGLLAAHEIPADAEVILEGGLYRYVDPALEAATPAQKHLMRMGPENAGKVRAALRRLRGVLAS